MEDWVPLSEVNFFDESVLQIHVDTRDFNCLLVEEKKEIPDLYKLKKYPDRFFYTAEEVESLIKRYAAESGEDKKWRYFTLEGFFNWSLKYIRIYRTENNMFLICNRDGYALRKEFTDRKIERGY